MTDLQEVCHCLLFFVYLHMTQLNKFVGRQ